MEEKIAYKVVMKTRESCSACGKYKLKYEKGDIVKAVSGTLGIFVFNCESLAKLFKEMFPGKGVLMEVIKVRVIGQARSPVSISSSIYETGIERFYKGIHDTTYGQMLPPHGTMCYPEVEVLE